jgi:UDPglucose 6-dehydrogenase
MKIAMMGSGYVGLVTGACLAEVGNTVVCVDRDSDKVKALNAGAIPIFEPGLERIVAANRAAGRLSFTTRVQDAIEVSDIIFIAVGTPADENGAADLQHVLAAASSIGEVMSEPKIIVTKSTVPVGTASRVKQAIADQLTLRSLDIQFYVASNPEFLKEGSAIEDFLKPDRIVIGVEDEAVKETMKALYSPFNRNRDRLIVMDVISAELTKYAANSMLATKISFMNEMANIAERVGADIENVRRGIGSDPRIGHHFIYPGCGYGGSCFPKDISALASTAKLLGYDTPLLDAVELVNERQKLVPIRKIKRRFGDDLSGRHFAIWGLAFKPNTDDMREAPSILVIRELIAAGATIAAFDPVARGTAESEFRDLEGLSFSDDPYDALRGAHALLLLTEWSVFRSPDLARMADLLEEKVIIDGRNVFDPDDMRRDGFEYFGIGRGEPQFDSLEQ